MHLGQVRPGGSTAAARWGAASPPRRRGPPGRASELERGAERSPRPAAVGEREPRAAAGAGPAGPAPPPIGPCPHSAVKLLPRSASSSCTQRPSVRWLLSCAHGRGCRGVLGTEPGGRGAAVSPLPGIAGSPGGRTRAASASCHQGRDGEALAASWAPSQGPRAPRPRLLLGLRPVRGDAAPTGLWTRPSRPFLSRISSAGTTCPCPGRSAPRWSRGPQRPPSRSPGRLPSSAQMPALWFPLGRNPSPSLPSGTAAATACAPGPSWSPDFPHVGAAPQVGARRASRGRGDLGCVAGPLHCCGLGTTVTAIPVSRNPAKGSSQGIPEGMKAQRGKMTRSAHPKLHLPLLMAPSLLFPNYPTFQRPI